MDTRCAILNYLKLIKKRASGKHASKNINNYKFKLVKNRIHAAVSLTGCFCTLATGELMTMAKWMREFVAKHPEYKQDSVISDKINYDLIQQCDRISKGEEACPELIGTPGNKVK